jgi:hypothetical protein
MLSHRPLSDVMLSRTIPPSHDKGVDLVAANVDSERSNVMRPFLCVYAANGEGQSVSPTYKPLIGTWKSRGWRIPR